MNSFDGVSRDQNRRFGPGGVIKAAMSDRGPLGFLLRPSSIGFTVIPALFIVHRALENAVRAIAGAPARARCRCISAYFPLIKSVTLR
jgi:hypothetical protein